MQNKRLLVFQLTALITLGLASMPGCSSHETVRHLSSEVSLIVPGHSTQQEVLSFMGFPARKDPGPDNTEIWVYYYTIKSLIRRTPYIGQKLGYEEYEVATVTFLGDIVQTCQYRLYNEEQFRELGLLSTEDTGDE